MRTTYRVNCLYTQKENEVAVFIVYFSVYDDALSFFHSLHKAANHLSSSIEELVPGAGYAIIVQSEQQKNWSGETQ